jgi:hypothetical protein
LVPPKKRLHSTLLLRDDTNSATRCCGAVGAAKSDYKRRWCFVVDPIVPLDVAMLLTTLVSHGGTNSATAVGSTTERKPLQLCVPMSKVRIPHLAVSAVSQVSWLSSCGYRYIKGAMAPRLWIWNAITSQGDL